MKKYNPLQELNTSPDSEFIRAVDFVVAQPIQGHLLKPVSLGYTPFVFRLCCDTGIETVSTNYLVIEKVMSLHLNRMDRDGINSHNVTPEQLKQIPVQLNDPIAVIQSQTKANGLVVLTELYETDKFSNRQNPMIVAIHLKNNRNKTQHMKITSVHGRSNEFIVDNLSSNLLIYLNREKCRNLMISHFTPERLRNLHKDNNRNERLKVIAEMCDLEMHKGRFQLKTTAPIAEGNFLLQTKNDHLYETDNNAKIKTMQEEIHKGRFLNTDETTMEVQVLLQENDHLYGADNNAKSETMQKEMHKGRYQLKTYNSNRSRVISLQTDNDHADNTAPSPQNQAAKRTILTPTGYKTEEDLRQFRLDMVKRHFQDQLSTLSESEQQNILAYEKGASEIWERLPDEKTRNALATNFYTNAARSIENGEKLPPAMSNAAAKDALENRRENNEPDINIDDDIEIDR